MYVAELFRMTFPLAAQRIKLTPVRAKLDRFNTIGEFEAFVAAHPQERFAFYRDLTERKKREFTTVIDHLGLDLAGAAHLDIGPAYGETLDIAINERGAKRADFIELDDCFYTWNRLKRVGQSFRGNYLTVVPRLKGGAYNLIYVRGLPQVETMWPLMGSRIGFIRLDQWLDQLARAAAPGGTIILSPNWRSSDGRRTATPDWSTHSFCELMRDKGFRTLPYLEGHNKEPEYPVTFVLKKPSVAGVS